MIAGLVFVAVMARRRPLAWDTVTLGGALVALALTLPGQGELWLRLHGDAGGDAMVEEDATGMAAMIPGGGRWSLWVNGRTNSSLPFGGFHTLLGAAPAVMHAEPREVAIVGLGSGDTAWASACRRESSRVTVYEICAPQIALLQRLARSPEPPPRLLSFLQDPRITTVVADGRNALARSAPRFDVIEMDALFPSSPFSGNLYSVEFFRLCASRLRPGGLMCAWSPKPRVTATFMAAFRHVVEMRQGQLLVGSNEPIEIAVDAWRAPRQLAGGRVLPGREQRAQAGGGAGHGADRGAGGRRPGRPQPRPVSPRRVQGRLGRAVTAGSPVDSFRSTKHFR